MKALPARFTEWLGNRPFLGEICPARENKGEQVQRISVLSLSELVEGQPVFCNCSLELIRGGLFYAIDALSAAHEIFQKDSSALGSYWHGMMHRREGDFGNACYWFRTAGKIPALADWPEFDQVSFTMRCSRSRGADPDLVATQRKEWEELMRFCLNQALGSHAC